MEYCSYGNLHDELIRDRIVIGLHSAALTENGMRGRDHQEAASVPEE